MTDHPGVRRNRRGEHQERRQRTVLLFLHLLTAACLLIAPAVAGPEDVTVTSVAIDPPVLMQGDSGTLTVVIQNTGPTSVQIGRARLYGDGIVPVSEPYPSVGDIGAGTGRTFSFAVRADAPDGTYYPEFHMDFRENGSFRYPVAVRVDDTPLSLEIVGRPETFSPGREATLTLQVGNPRPNAADGVRVTPLGEGFAVTPTGAFIGNLAPDGSATVLFNLTPADETNATFQVTWRNGPNTHTADIMLPVSFGEDKQRADLVASNIEVVPEGEIYRATGDVANAGLEPAHSVIVTSGPPTSPTDPYRVYVVGTLDPDDVAPFEVTFRAGAEISEILLIIDYRDSDGNPFSTTVPVSINRTAEGGVVGSGFLAPVAIGGVLVLVLAAGIAVLWYLRRRRR